MYLDKVCDVARFATWQTRKRLLAARRRAPDAKPTDACRLSKPPDVGKLLQGIAGATFRPGQAGAVAWDL